MAEVPYEILIRFDEVGKLYGAHYQARDGDRILPPVPVRLALDAALNSGAPEIAVILNEVLGTATAQALTIADYEQRHSTELEANLATITQTLGETKASLSTAEAKIAELEPANAALMAEIAALKSALDQTTRQLGEAKQELSEVQAELVHEQEQRALLIAEIDALKPPAPPAAPSP